MVEVRDVQIEEEEGHTVMVLMCGAEMIYTADSSLVKSFMSYLLLYNKYPPSI